MNFELKKIELKDTKLNLNAFSDRRCSATQCLGILRIVATLALLLTSLSACQFINEFNGSFGSLLLRDDTVPGFEELNPGIQASGDSGILQSASPESQPLDYRKLWYSAHDISPEEALGAAVELRADKDLGFGLVVWESGSVGIFEGVSAQTKKLFEFPGSPGKISISPNLRFIAAGIGSNLHIVDLSNNFLKTQSLLKARATSIDFAPDSKSVLVGAADGRIYRWKFLDDKPSLPTDEREKLVERYIGHAGVVSAIRFHTFGRIFFSGDWFGRLNVWMTYDSDRYGGKYDKRLFDTLFFSESQVYRGRAGRREQTSVDNIMISRDGELLYAVGQDGQVGVWSVRGLSRLAMLGANKGEVFDITLSQNGKTSCSIGRDAFLRCFKLTITNEGGTQASAEKIFEIEVPGAKSISFYDDSSLIIGRSDSILELIGLIPQNFDKKNSQDLNQGNIENES